MSHARADEPPPEMVDEALRHARQRACAKSYRGSVVYGIAFDGSAADHGHGHNGPPRGFACDGSEACRKACRYLCEHAEARAVREAIEYAHFGPFDLVHVKADAAGELVAGGGPSCAACSRLILDVGFIAGVWLYEMNRQLDTSPELDGSGVFVERPAWRRYTADQFHEISLRASGLPVIRSPATR